MCKKSTSGCYKMIWIALHQEWRAITQTTLEHQYIEKELNFSHYLVFHIRKSWYCPCILSRHLLGNHSMKEYLQLIQTSVAANLERTYNLTCEWQVYLSNIMITEWNCGMDVSGTTLQLQGLWFDLDIRLLSVQSRFRLIDRFRKLNCADNGLLELLKKSQPKVFPGRIRRRSGWEESVWDRPLEVK